MILKCLIPLILGGQETDWKANIPYFFHPFQKKENSAKENLGKLILILTKIVELIVRENQYKFPKYNNIRPLSAFFFFSHKVTVAAMIRMDFREVYMSPLQKYP